MKKFGVQVVVLLVIICVGLFSLFATGPWGNALVQNNQTRELLINNRKIQVEVADTAEKRRVGLSGRESLAPDSGMLFVFNQPDNYKFWMKDVKFPLDFIYIKGGKIVDFRRNVPIPPPNTPEQDIQIYQSLEEFDSMLEVNAGFIDRYQIDIGQSVSLVSP